uniref:DUF5641 domain-containing protein n=1 Tax=Glossina austeni TaxID=7395 RepID=A0A1A9V028_GLOAU
MNCVDKPTFYWTDSQIVSCLASQSISFQTFLAKRIRTQELSSYTQWRRERSKDTPADVVTRELMPGELKDYLRKSSQLNSLNPFVDERGIIRVGRRLQSAAVSYDAQHLTLLPYNNTLYKWRLKTAVARSGMMVTIKEDNTPLFQRPFARLLANCSRNGENVRAGYIMTASGICKRPVHRLATLPITDERDHMPITEDTTPVQSTSNTPQSRRKLALNFNFPMCLVALLLLPILLSNPVRIQIALGKDKILLTRHRAKRGHIDFVRRGPQHQHHQTRRKIAAHFYGTEENAQHERLFKTLAESPMQLTLTSFTIESTQETILEVLMDSHHKRINLLLLKPQQFKEELSENKLHAPHSMQIPEYPENLLSLYKLISVQPGITERHIIFKLVILMTGSVFTPQSNNSDQLINQHTDQSDSNFHLQSLHSKLEVLSSIQFGGSERKRLKGIYRRKDQIGAVMSTIDQESSLKANYLTMSTDKPLSLYFLESLLFLLRIFLTCLFNQGKKVYLSVGVLNDLTGVDIEMIDKKLLLAGNVFDITRQRYVISCFKNSILQHIRIVLEIINYLILCLIIRTYSLLGYGRNKLLHDEKAESRTKKI